MVGGMPIAVTFCTLCNSGITFDRRVNCKNLSFGVTGKLRNSDMIMYDCETQSWRQHAEGCGIVGELKGQVLETLPTWMESWAEFKARNPDGLVMTQSTTYRDYGVTHIRAMTANNARSSTQAKSHLIMSHPWPVLFVWKIK
jgi:hypothetical protein